MVLLLDDILLEDDWVGGEFGLQVRDSHMCVTQCVTQRVTQCAIQCGGLQDQTEVDVQLPEDVLAARVQISKSCAPSVSLPPHT